VEEYLQQLIELQKEQNRLLKRYLWRLRFSLLGLLLMTTAIALVLGFVAYRTHSQSAPPTPVPLRMVFPPPVQSPAPAGEIQVRPDVPSTS
jgi:hypothetical protein